MADWDETFMRRALALAERGWGKTNPNPLVGAVIVKEGAIIAEGWHERLGGPHAEIAALEDARQKGADVRGAVLYVTLEPCCHQGRTPPCSLAIIHAGLSRVVAAMEDPNPLVAGKGLEHLRQNGVEVEVGVFSAEARKLNEIFIHFITHRRPFVHIKAAASWDGKSASRTGESRWISGEESRALTHRWRDRYAAILVGIGTVLADDPYLTARNSDGQALEKQPLRVVLDSMLRLPPESRLADTATTWPLLVVCARNAPEDRLKALEAKGVEVLRLPGLEGELDLSSLLRHLYEREIDSVLVEGGADTSASFVAAGLADKVSIFLAPILMGGRDAVGILGGKGAESPALARKLFNTSMTPVGKDILLEGYLDVLTTGKGEN